MHGPVPMLVVRNDPVRTRGLCLEIVEFFGRPFQCDLTQNVVVNEVVPLDVSRAVKTPRRADVDGVRGPDEHRPRVDRNQRHMEPDGLVEARGKRLRQCSPPAGHGKADYSDSVKSHFLESLLGADSAGQHLVNERTGSVVATELELAADSRARNRGLLGRSGIAAGSVMIIAPCNAIHMFFMRFTIDVVFVDRQGRVLRLYRGVRPWRVRAAIGAFAALELAAGAIDRVEMVRGDGLAIEGDGSRSVENSRDTG